jgi:hypothetical protein
MNNPNIGQQSQNDIINHDPMYYKACKVACTLVEVTERFLATINHLQQSFNNQSYTNITNDLKQLLEQYEHVSMIVNVLKSIYPFISNQQHQNSLSIAAKSAAITSLNSLNRLYELANSSLQNISVDVATQQALAAIQQQILQSNAENNEEFGTKTVTLKPVNDSIEDERKKLELERQQLEREKEEFEKQKQMMLTIAPPPAATVKAENNNEIPEGLQQQLQIENGLQSQVISSSHFLTQFEMTASSFASLNRMSIDCVWESMIIYALPADKAEWAKVNLLERNLTWNEAKLIYLRRFPDTGSTSPPPPLPAMDQAVAPPKQPEIQLKQKALPPITNTKIDLQRVARYADHLLSLEMNVNDNIDEYNTRYLRYSRCARMDLNDASLIRRYCKSLLPHYRALLIERLKTSSINNLQGVTSLASSLAKANPAPTKYTQNCIHNRSMLHAVPVNQNTTYRSPPANGDSTSKGQKREFMGSPSGSSLRNKRPTVF